MGENHLAEIEESKNFFNPLLANHQTYSSSLDVVEVGSTSESSSSWSSSAAIPSGSDIIEEAETEEHHSKEVKEELFIGRPMITKIYLISDKMTSSFSQ